MGIIIMIHRVYKPEQPTFRCLGFSPHKSN